MTTRLSILQLPNRAPIAPRAKALALVLGIAAFALGVTMLSQGVALFQPVAPGPPITPASLGRAERVAPARDERPAVTTPAADRVPFPPVTSTATSGAIRLGSACLPRLALECDARLGLMEVMWQQRGRFLGPFVVPDKEEVPAKYRALARVEASVTRATPSPPAAPQANTPGC